MFTTTAAKFIREICKNKHCNSLTNFMHDITFSKKQISMLVSDEKIFSFYYENKIPTLCTNDSGRTLSAGIYLNKTLENIHKDCAILMPLLVKVGRKLGQNYGSNSVHIVVRENDCQHFYSLFFDLKENDFLHWVVNNGSFLHDFINQYNISAKDIILEAKIDKNRIVLPTFSDFASSMNIDNAEITPQFKVFHKNLHMPIYLSNQLGRCFQLLLKGKSAKQIGLEMKLSHRTVEHYIEKIRRQLGCSTTRELIVSYNNQLS